MLKIQILCFCLLLIGCFSSLDCIGKDCSVEEDSPEPIQISEAIPLVDQEIRRIYWYFLRNSKIVYQVNLDTPEEFLLFFIYRNVLGTFLAIAVFDKADKTS